MSEKKRRTYIPPRIMDLSGYSAAGQTEGRCATGTFPYYVCQVGTAYIASCTTGTGVDTSSCTGGGVHYYPACKPGGGAITGCLSGSHQNF